MDLDGLKLLLSSTSAELAELELKRYHWWLRYYEEWHGEVPRADQNSANSAAVALLRSACSAVAGESWRHLWGSWIRCSDMPTGDPTDHFLLFYGTRTMGFIWTSHQVQKYGPRSVMFSGRPVLHGLCPWWESCAEGAIRVRSLSENWQNVDRVTVMRGYKWEMIWEIDLKSQRLRSQIFSDLLSVTVFFSVFTYILSTDFHRLPLVFSASVGSVVSRLLGSAASWSSYSRVTASATALDLASPSWLQFRMLRRQKAMVIQWSERCLQIKPKDPKTQRPEGHWAASCHES